MLITYILHSGFLVELENIVLLFDYYRGAIPPIPEGKPLYVFASHKHADHFNFHIFGLRGTKGELPCYFLGSDIRMSPAYMERKGIVPELMERIRFVHKEERIWLETPEGAPLLIETIPSTDAGVAFIVESKGQRIYHAGDLNWWSFRGSSAEAEQDMEQRFIKEMDKLNGQAFDAAFLPLDPRQEDRFFWGFDYFMRVTDTRAAFPMHFWEDYSVIARLKDLEASGPYHSRIADIVKPGQTFLIS